MRNVLRACLLLVVTSAVPGAAIAQAQDPVRPAETEPPPAPGPTMVPQPGPGELAAVPVAPPALHQMKLYDGSTVCGVLMETVPSRHIIVKIASGEIRTLDWNDVVLSSVRPAAVCPGQPDPHPAPATPPVPVPTARSAPVQNAEPELVPTRSIAPQRQWGIGTYGGAGFVYATDGSSQVSVVALGFQLPTIELQFFNSRGRSVDVTLPIAGIVYNSVMLKGFWFLADIRYNFNVGSGSTRFLIGPGGGLAFFGGSGIGAAALRIPAMIGVELLTPGRGFGFKLMARPFLQYLIGVGGSSAAAGFGGGIIAELGLSLYRTGS